MMTRCEVSEKYVEQCSGSIIPPVVCFLHLLVFVFPYVLIFIFSLVGRLAPPHPFPHAIHLYIYIYISRICFFACGTVGPMGPPTPPLYILIHYSLIIHISSNNVLGVEPHPRYHHPPTLHHGCGIKQKNSTTIYIYI